MNQFVDCPSTGVTFPDGSIYQSCGALTEKTESPSQPQMVRMDVDEMQADRHAPWASCALPTPEVVVYCIDVPRPREILHSLDP